MWLAKRAGAFSNPRFRKLINTVVLAVCVVAVLFAVDAFQLRTKVSTLERYYKETSQEQGAAASRTGVWHDSIHTILKYPLLGIRISGEQEEITSEYASQGSYLSHNVFLDYGRYMGIPGMLLLAMFFFWPAVKMWRSGNYIRYLPFLLAHFALLIFWMSLSFQFYKTFWALWMLMAVAGPAVAAKTASLDRPKSLVPQRVSPANFRFSGLQQRKNFVRPRPERRGGLLARPFRSKPAR